MYLEINAINYLILCLSVCLLAFNWILILCGTSHEPKKGLWTIKIKFKKIRVKKRIDFFKCAKYKNPPKFDDIKNGRLFEQQLKAKLFTRKWRRYTPLKPNILQKSTQTKTEKLRT